MKHSGARVRAAGTAALLLLLISAAGAQTEAGYPELPNYHQVNAQLYRGAQPKRGGLALLARRGVKTIINLRAADENAQAEEAEARALGLNYYNVALPGLSRPAETAVERALELIADPQLQPVFVHCRRGADRTGTVIACYRIKHEGWTAQAAIAEAKRHGLSWFERGMKDFIGDYARRRAATQPATRAVGPPALSSRRADLKGVEPCPANLLHATASKTMCLSSSGWKNFMSVSPTAASSRTSSNTIWRPASC